MTEKVVQFNSQIPQFPPHHTNELNEIKFCHIFAIFPDDPNANQNLIITEIRRKNVSDIITDTVLTGLFFKLG